MVEVDEGVAGPELASDLVAGEDLSGAGEEEDERLEGLRVELDADAGAAEFAGGGVGLEGAETEAPGWGWVGHGVSG